MTAARAPFRIPRAAAVAVTVLALAATAHLLAGGELPAFPVMTALTAVIALSAIMLTGRKMTVPLLAVYLGASQAALHLAFSALAGAGTPRPGLSHHLGMAAGPGSGHGVVPHEHLSSDASPGMLGLHVAAILATALLMARGESALWALAAWLRPLLGLLKPSKLRACPSLPVTGTETIHLRRNRQARPPARGPPRNLSAATHQALA
ncbi:MULTISPECIES: hypothetical protein [unclassified Arthrobacter]|uniref:hypothetical protein n=1 Tax=unclassified Arthrobacter TaxID=235627 RepID=UPI001656C7C0|nr:MULTISPECIES: hypothetical protein [unclassified Arthrobacter]QSZ51442.1 hypothetical protein AYX22_23315 [Arthrobacter sp. D5-1]